MRQDKTAPYPRQTNNVIAMNSHRPTALFPHISEVEAYWQALRGTRLAPTRSEVDPRGIARALERAFILERVAPGIGRLRIAGTHLADLMGMEVRGMPLSAFIVPDARLDLSIALEIVFTRPSAVCLTLKSDGGIGKPPLDARLLMLPLRDAMGAMTRVLGCFDTLGPLGRAPRRFAITARKITPLTGEDYIPAETLAAPLPAMADWFATQAHPAGVAPAPLAPETPPRNTPAKATGFHEDGARFTPAPRSISYLRLVTPDM